MSKLVNTLKNIGESNLLDILDQDLIELIDLLDLTNYENGSLWPIWF